MPIHKFKCACGVCFEKMSSLEHHPCPACGKLAEKRISAGRFSFSFVPDGPKPQNTGASSVDHDLDRVIGESAKRNLLEFQTRTKYKKGVMYDNGVWGDFLSREEDGEYFVMEDEERRAAKTARLINQEATRFINEHLRRVK